MGSSRMASRMGSAYGGFWFMTTEVKERMDKMKKSREVYSQVFSNENFPSPMPPFSSQNVSLFKFLVMNLSCVTKDQGFIKIFSDEIHISSLNHTFSDET